MHDGGRTSADTLEFSIFCRRGLFNRPFNMARVIIRINLGPGGNVDYVSGAPTTPSAEHWTWNNQYAAIAANNPFPGVGRNVIRGDSRNDLDMSAGNNFKLTERLNMQWMVSVFNLTNLAYYGTPDIFVEDSTLGSFLNDSEGIGTAQESDAGGGSYPQDLGNRNVQFTGKIVF